MKDLTARKKIKIISEEYLFGQAEKFIGRLMESNISLLSTSQAQGLESIARTTEELNAIIYFARKQQEKDIKHSPFYGALLNKINELKDLVKKHELVPKNLTVIEEKSQRQEYELLLIREFIYHLVSHNLYIA